MLNEAVLKCAAISQKNADREREKEERLNKWYCFNARLPVWMGTVPKGQHWVTHSTHADMDDFVASLCSPYFSSDGWKILSNKVFKPHQNPNLNATRQ